MKQIATGKTVFAAAAALVMGSLFAEPSVTLIKTDTRWPWNGKVDVQYSLSGLVAEKSYELVTEVAVAGATNAVTNAVASADGTFDDVIDCDRLFGSEIDASATLSLRLLEKTDDAVPADATGTPVGAKGDVLIIDVSGGPSAASYPVTYLNGIDMGCFNCDAYKTSKIVMRKVPAGTYLAKPRVAGNITDDDTLSVTNTYYIGVFELTQKQYENVMGSVPSGQSQTSDTRPVANLEYDSWRGRVHNPMSGIYAKADSSWFLPRLVAKTGLPTLDLPTEGQWQIAVHAGSKYDYGSYLKDGSVYNNNADLVAWFNWNNGKNSGADYPTGVKPVGLKYPNLWGLYDMQGNVAEWCRDNASSASYIASPDVPDIGEDPNSWNRVTYGGGYAGGQWLTEIGYMNPRDRSAGGDSVGMRLAYTVKPKLSAPSPVADATGTPSGIRADVMVVDVSAGSSASSYTVEKYRNVDLGCFNCDAYKTGKIVLRRVPAGTYRIKPGAGTTYYPTASDEVTTTKDFYIGLFEITQKQWRNVTGSLPYSETALGDTYPVGKPSWNSIRSPATEPTASISPEGDGFAALLVAKTGMSGFDLPTEAQWEIAARGGMSFCKPGYIGDGGFMEVDTGLDSMPSVVWYGANNTEEASGYPAGNKPVGLLPPNPMGLYDVFGNVAEWVRDGVAATYSADYVESPNPGTDDKRVARGGDCSNSIYTYAADKCVGGRATNFKRSDQWAALGLRICFVCE